MKTYIPKHDKQFGCCAVLLIAGVLAAVLGLGSYAAVSASASTASSPTKTGVLCMNIQRDNCLETHGPDNQLTLTSKPQATVIDLYAGYNQLKVAGTNHCLSDANGQVVLKTCNDTYVNQQYRAGDYNGVWNFYNVGRSGTTGQDDYLATYCNAPNKAYDLNTTNCFNWVWN